MTLVIEPATADRWPDVQQAFGRASRNPDACWCQRFMSHDRESNEQALHHEVDHAKVPIGLLAYLDGSPVGWARVMPRKDVPGVLANRALQRLLDDDPDSWWTTCVVIQPAARGRGIGVALLKSAADFARDHGASVLDGHPVDVSMSAKRPSPSALFTGTVSMFRSAGFSEIGQTYPSRPVMRVELA